MKCEINPWKTKRYREELSLSEINKGEPSFNIEEIMFQKYYYDNNILFYFFLFFYKIIE